MNFSSITEQLNQFIISSREHLPLTLIMIGVLWAIQVLNTLLGGRLNALGIYPRRLYGLPGIIFAPFLHGGFEHVFFNSIPLFILLNLLLLDPMSEFILVLVSIAVLGGFLTWLFGRRAIHIGASSLVMGLWGFFLFEAILRPGVNTIIVAFVIVYFLGGMFFLNLFPSDAKTSWEGHVFGCVAGVATAYGLPWLLQVLGEYHLFG
jgi:membrane associated rhomboid family serine protease